MDDPSTAGRTERRRVAAIAWAPYLVSLALPCIHVRDHAPVYGFGALYGGVFGVLLLNFAWFANPLFWFATQAVLKSKPGRAAILSAGALLLSMQSFLLEEVWFNEARGTPVERLGIGFVVWAASFAVLLAGALLLFARRCRSSPSPAGASSSST